jgi:hypothetical protein
MLSSGQKQHRETAFHTFRKLLFYADFLRFKENQVFITGSQYAALPYGPVPGNYTKLPAVIEKDLSIVETQEVSCENSEYIGQTARQRLPAETACNNQPEYYVHNSCLPLNEGGVMKWVTSSHVHVDRVACPWLIKRFIDSQAEILFVSRGRIKAVAASENAIPFDAPGVEYGHHNGKCSFETLIEKFELKDRGLLRLARIIHAADTDEIDSDPLARGFEAIAVGYSLRFPDDKKNLEKQFEVYDSLYAWCRLDVARNCT